MAYNSPLVVVYAGREGVVFLAFWRFMMLDNAVVRWFSTSDVFYVSDRLLAFNGCCEPDYCLFYNTFDYCWRWYNGVVFFLL